MRAIVIGAAIVPIALFFFTIKIQNNSAFFVLMKILPGAVGIRSGYRAMIVANFFAVIAGRLRLTAYSGCCRHTAPQERQ